MSGMVRHRRRLGAAIVVVLGAFAYLWRLGTASWQGDEAIYASAARDLLASGGEAASQIGHPPLAILAFAGAEAVNSDDQLAVRLASAFCGLAVGLVLFVLVRRMAGWWAGIGAATLWVALPHALRTPGLGLDKLDRFGRIDAVAALPLAVALLLGWRWIEDGRRRWAVGAGAAVGLAAAAKLPFGLAVLAIVVTGVIIHRHDLRRVIVDVAAMAAASMGALALAYVPFGTQAWARFTEMVEFQREHATTGHPVLIGATVHDHAPWWTNFWFTWRDDGALLTVALVALAACSVAWPSRHRLAGAYLLAAALVPAVFLAASPVALPHYRFVWLVPLFGAAAVGASTSWRRGGLPRGAAALAMAALAVVAVDHLASIATMESSGYGDAAARLEQAGLDDGTIAHRAAGPIIEAYFPDAVEVGGLPADVVILDDGIISRFPDPAFVDALDVAVAGAGCEARIDQLRVVLPAGGTDACAALLDR